jgi:hypothetical protein
MRGVVFPPRLFERLGAARVSAVSAPAGSGKTVLLRSWISDAGLAGGAVWVSVGKLIPPPVVVYVFGLTRSINHLFSGRRGHGRALRLASPKWTGCSRRKVWIWR